MYNIAFTISRDTIYDDSAVVLALGIPLSSLARARREKKLQFRRIGGRVIYKGAWLLDWLETDPKTTAVTSDGGRCA